MKTGKYEESKSLISARRIRRGSHLCMTFAACVVILVAALYTSGCGSGSAASSASSEQQSSTPTSGPRTPSSGDLRFQQVDAPSQAQQGMPGAGEVASDVMAGAQWMWPDYTGTPLELAWDNCNQSSGSFGSCGWGFSVLKLPSGQPGLTVYYKSGAYASFAADLASVLPASAVVTSLDLEPANGAYAVAWIQTVDECSFDMKREVVPLSQVESTIAQDAGQSRVVTAVSFDASGQVNLLSYGWSDDAVTVYETAVVNVAGQDIAAAATNLAGEGYIITAFGGNTTEGYLLIGTRVAGDSVPRPILVATQANTPFPAGAEAGYAMVGFANYGVSVNAAGYAQPLYAAIYEK
jgi:hypothetical protein